MSDVLRLSGEGLGIMIIRIWRAEVDPSRVAQYEEFAREHSLPMFRKQRGLLGVVFSRASNRALVLTIWENQEAIADLEASPTYRDTVTRIHRAGFVREDTTVELFDVHGGTLTSALLDRLPE